MKNTIIKSVLVAVLMFMSTIMSYGDRLTCNHEWERSFAKIPGMSTPNGYYVCAKCGEMAPNIVGQKRVVVWKIGDEVIFMYYGCDSRKDVEQRGTIIGRRGKEYIIFPMFQIAKFGNYVYIKSEKILRMAEESK